MSTLVRVWNGFQEEVASDFIEWEGSGFTLPVSDPLAKLLFDSAHRGNLRLTVYSTDELLWNVKQVDVTRGGATVHCAPFIDQLRDSLISDDYLVSMWLDAERRWQESLI